MLKVGQAEIDRVSKLIRSGKLFRYRKEGECNRFESRYATFLGVKHVHMTSSGTTALTAALAGLGIGPGMEVLVPAHTYMATAVAVLGAGAIPVIVDVDESLTISPDAIDDAVCPLTRAVIPVHMWGLPCNMDAIMRVARKRKLLVIEDACQGVGGAYEGQMLGSIGDAGAFSFNYYKNMTCGEGGAFVCNDDLVARQGRCMIDCCSFYWNGREADVKPFTSNGSRASELEGAMLNAQLDRIRGLIRACRAQKKAILKAVAKSSLKPAPCHSLDFECGTTVAFTFGSREDASDFAAATKGTVAAKTGRHTYNEWDPILARRGAHHPALDPFNLPQNRKCRMKYSADMLPRSLDILHRTVMVGTHPDRTAAQVKEQIERLLTVAGATKTR